MKTDPIKDLVIAIGGKKEEVDFDSVDGKLVYLDIMIGANTQSRNDYLMVLAKTCLLLKDPEFREKMINAPSSEPIIELLKNKSASRRDKL